MMPEIDGFEVCRRIREEGDVPVLMLAAKDSVADRVLGFDSGADDYLVKPFAYEELLARMRRLFRRSEPGGHEVLSCADLTADVEALEVRRGDRRVDLTVLEFRLLEYMMRNARIVLSRSRILEAVWGLDIDTTNITGQGANEDPMAIDVVRHWLHGARPHRIHGAYQRPYCRQRADRSECPALRHC